MIITFPNFGNTCFAIKALFDDLKIDYVIPPISNKEALEIGTLYSPDEICLPFKIMLGNYIQSIKMGADTILLMSSCGPCRFGEYCELMPNLLKKLNYNVNYIVIDYPKDIGKKEFLHRLSMIISDSKVSTKKKIKAVASAYKVIRLIDKFEQKARILCGYEAHKGTCKSILYKCKREALKAYNSEEMISIIKIYFKELCNVEIVKNKKPIKISIIGEIYTIMEPFSNLYIEDKLMDYGVSSKRRLTTSWWFKNAILAPLKLNSINIRKASLNYLPYYIGGHARECIGEAVLSSNENFDGVIQIFPMGCMPEIVSKSILPTISKDLDIPIMTLIVDEMTGEAGFITRIEAFIDLLERRHKNVLSRS